MHLALLLASLACLCVPAYAESDRLLVHEWGTFTSLQDETGRAIGGIDGDVEPLPPFVHDLSKPANIGSGPNIFTKGLPPDPGVTMRLETPVVYFYPRGNSPSTVTFSVDFKGGILSQFYPKARTSVASGAIPKVTPLVSSQLAWNDVRINTKTSGPKTDSHVWLAPRKVASADVTVGEESERYLFYRGVGSIDSPLRIVRQNNRLEVIPQLASSLGDAKVRFAKVWYFDMRADGTCAFSSFEPEEVSAKSHDPIGWMEPNFKEPSYSAGNLKELRADMHKALVADGLFADEADAMLSTWEASYFKSPDARVFFVVPKAWTEQYLPIKVSEDAEIARVMVGRIDLITPAHRKAVEAIMALGGNPNSDAYRTEYAKLGRFAAAILKDEQSRNVNQQVGSMAPAHLIGK